MSSLLSTALFNLYKAQKYEISDIGKMKFLGEDNPIKVINDDKFYYQIFFSVNYEELIIQMTFYDTNIYNSAMVLEKIIKEKIKEIEGRKEIEFNSSLKWWLSILIILKECCKGNELYFAEMTCNVVIDKIHKLTNLEISEYVNLINTILLDEINSGIKIRPFLYTGHLRENKDDYLLSFYENKEIIKEIIFNKIKIDDFKHPDIIKEIKFIEYFNLEYDKKEIILEKLYNTCNVFFAPKLHYESKTELAHIMFIIISQILNNKAFFKKDLIKEIAASITELFDSVNKI